MSVDPVQLVAGGVVLAHVALWIAIARDVGRESRRQIPPERAVHDADDHAGVSTRVQP